MSRILFAWELGGNYGHISMILLIARQLRQRGHDILFAVKSSDRIEQLLEDDGFCYVKSPCPSSRQVRRRTPVSYADILISAGFDSPQSLAELVDKWHELFGTFQPDVVVAQYAPVAQVSARLADRRCLSINTGFESPPVEAPYLCFRPSCQVTQEQLLAKEAGICQNINGIFASRQMSFKNIQEAFRSDLDLLVTLPEMDHYRRRNGRFIGPISMLDDGNAISWSHNSLKKIFVYLRPFAGLEMVLNVLKNQAAEVIACIAGVDNQIIKLFAGQTFHISPSRVKLSALLPKMDLAITHSGHGTTGAMLLAGVPMLMMPTTIEQWLLSRNMTKLGIGIEMTRARIAADFPTVLAKLLGDPTYQARARSLAKKYAGYDQRRVIQQLANTIERLPDWAGKKNHTEADSMDEGRRMHRESGCSTK